MSKNNILKRLLSFILVLCIIMPTIFMSNSIEVKADSTALVNTYISLMNSSKISEISDMENLNQNDLKVISLFLSNFYSPFNSALDSDAKSYNLSTCIDILTALGLDQDAAKTLAATVTSCSLNYCSQLFYDKTQSFYVPNRNSYSMQKGVVSLGGKGNIPGLNDSTYSNDMYRKYTNCTNTLKISPDYAPLTVFSFWSLFSSVCKYYGDNEIDSNGDGIDDYIVNFYAATSIDSVDKVPVFKMNHAFAVYYGTLVTDMKTSWNEGYLGNAMINTAGSDVDSLDLDQFANLVPFTEPMYVDWVGNIIADVGDKRVVAVPAVMNPCCFAGFEQGETFSYDEETGALQGGQDIMYMFSTFGIKALQKYILPDTYVFNSKGTSNFFRLTRGSNTKASWDANLGHWGGGWAKSYKNNLDNIGINVSSGTQNKWAANTCYLTIPNEDRCRFVDSDKLIWSGVRFNEYTTSEESSVVRFNLVDNSTGEVVLDGIDNNRTYFATTDAYTHSDKFEAILGVETDDMSILSSMFLTYVYLYKNGVSSTGETFLASESKIPIAYMSPIFPQAEGEVTFTTTGTMEDEVTSLIYYLLHPTKGAEYFVNWIKNKVSSLFVGWHEDIVGGTDSNVTTGMTKYVGFSGYVTVPNLKDIEFLDWLMSNYDVIIIYLILVIIAILACYVLVGQLTFYRALMGALLFAVLAFLPPRLMTFAINTINVCCDTIYSNKFDYWAIVQNQAYLPVLNTQIQNLTSTEGANLVDNTIRDGSSENVESYTNSSNSYTLVKIKWETPKRMNDIYKLEKELKSLNKDNTFSYSLINMTENVILSNDFSESVGSDGSYMYRNYMDLYTYSSVLYNLYTYKAQDGGTLGDGYNYKTNVFNDNKTKIDSNTIKGSIDSFTVNNPLASNTNEDNALGSDSNITAKYDSGKDMNMFYRANMQDVSNQGVQDTSSLKAIERGFLYSPVEANASNYYGYKTLATSTLVRAGEYIVPTALSSYANIYSTTLDNGIKLYLNKDELIKNDNPKLYYGLSSKNFQCTYADILAGNHKSTADVDHEFNEVKDKLPYVYYSCYTESPYYFFNFNIRDQLITQQYQYLYYNFGSTIVTQNESGAGLATTNVGKLVSMMLSDNSSYFYNTGIDAANDGYGQLRDFMNLHDLFYYVIPILNQGNKAVDIFDSVYNMETNDDCSYKVNAAGTIMYEGVSYDTNQDIFKSVTLSSLTTEEIYKLWHDMNVYSLFNLYTDWVETMYDCDYAHGETIKVAGKNFYVENPLDPTCYFELDDSGNIINGRYMVFSRSEMAYYGLKESDLTQVELKCIEVQDNVYKETLNLMNYNTFNDETLIQAYSMIQLFEFNKAFSQKSLISTDYILYPQSFELKAFTLDAYMRLILTSASGESLMENSQDGTNESIYSRILKNTSLFFGIILIINDFVCVYLLPGLRFIFLIVVFFMSIALIVAGAIKLYDDTGISLLQTCIDSLVKPLVAFIAISVGLAYVISLFMYDGPAGITNKGQHVISFNEPTLTVLFVTIINIIAIVLYWKILKVCFKDFVKYVKAISTSISGAVQGALGTVAKTAMGIGAYRVLTGKGGFGGADSGNGTSTSTASGSPDSRGKNNNNPTGQTGSGVGNSFGAGLGGALGGSTGGAISDAISGSTSTDSYNKGASDYHTPIAKDGQNAKDNLKQAKAEAEEHQKGRESKRQERTDKANASKQKADNMQHDLDNAKGVFKNKNAKWYDRAAAGADVAKSYIPTKIQNAKASIGRQKADLANGVSSRLDGLSNVMSGNSYRVAKAQQRKDVSDAARKQKLAGLKADAQARNDARYTQDRQNKATYHAKKQNSGTNLSSTMSNTQARKHNDSVVVNNATKFEEQRALRNRAAKSGIIIPN